MARPGKSLQLIEGHLTKAQIAERREAEAALAGGLKFAMSRAVKKDKLARKYWTRLAEIFADIGMEDAALENVLNRYCLMLSEHDGLLALLAEARAALDALEKMRNAMPPEVWLEKLQKQTEQVLGLETAIRKKRDQLLAVEKENLLTAQSKIRAVPKKKAEKKPTGIAAYRARMQAGGAER